MGVAQRTKASGCGPEDRGFKSLHPPHVPARLIHINGKFLGRYRPAMGLAALGAAFDLVLFHDENLAAGTGNFNSCHLRFPLIENN